MGKEGSWVAIRTPESWSVQSFSSVHLLPKHRGFSTADSAESELAVDFTLTVVQAPEGRGRH